MSALTATAVGAMTMVMGWMTAPIAIAQAASAQAASAPSASAPAGPTKPVSARAIAAQAGPTKAPFKAAAPAPGVNWDPSGQAMPVGDLPGWHQVFADNFANNNDPVGSFTGCTGTSCAGAPGVPFGAATQGSPDTSGHCQYWPSKTVSISGGIMNIFVHTDPNGVCMVAGVFPAMPKMAFQRYDVRFRGDPVPGYKGVDFLWPLDNVSGEIDYPENQLTSNVTGSLHGVAGGLPDQEFTTSTASTAWHTATLEWTPTSVTFLMDGIVVQNDTTYVPQTPMGLILRAESALGTPSRPAASAQGNFQTDWVTAYSYAPGAPSVGGPRCSAILPTGSVVGMAVTFNGDGYWIASSTGEVAACGNAPAFGNGVPGTAAIATAPEGDGYWLVTRSGAVEAFGSAQIHGGIPAMVRLAKPIVAMAVDPATGGYWLLGGDGGVFSYDAPFYGSTGNDHLVKPAVGLEVTLTGRGYRFVAADGGIFDFGDAAFYGSLGGIKLNQAVVGMADDPATGGYWLDAADGGIFSFHAPFYGSTGNIILAKPCVGMTATPEGDGYRFVASDGGIFDFASAAFEGSAAS